MGVEKSDQPGVLGNLPRSRPGQRSDKRAGAKRAAASASAKRATASRSTAARARKPAASRTRPPRDAAPEPPPAGAVDPLTLAFRTAGKVAELGLKTAGGILRRLPGR